jgi:hypothetical protein
MPENQVERSPRVWGRIDPNQDYEVRYWARKLGVDEQQLRETVQTAGPIIEKVKEHLSQNQR